MVDTRNVEICPIITFSCHLTPETGAGEGTEPELRGKLPVITPHV